MVLINEDGMAAALCIIIIHGAIRRGQINRNPAHRSCWVRPWIRRRPKVGTFRGDKSTENPQSFRIYSKNRKGKFEDLLGLFTLFISGLCLPLPFRST